jgi:hypothetical protein
MIEWISVRYRKPNSDRRVLIMNEDKEVAVGWYDTMWVCWDDCFDDEPEYWAEINTDITK